MRISRSPAWRLHAAVALASLFVGVVGDPARAQSTAPSGDFWRQFQQPPSTTPAAPGKATRTAAPAPAPATPRAGAPASPVIARVGGHDITQLDYDRIAGPYFKRLEAEMGPRFDADMRRQASQNVLDELIRRELVSIEAQRRNVTVTQADIDSVLMQDPLFQTNGRFDPQKFAEYKVAPGSNYAMVVPQVRQIAAFEKTDAALRRKFTPPAADVKAEWTRRTDLVSYGAWPLLLRDVSLDGEATEAEWAAYYRAHPDQFTRKPRAHLRYLRLPLPPATDSTRADAERTALVRARGIADSLRKRTLADTAVRLADSGPFEVPPTALPGVAGVPGLLDTLARLDRDSTIRIVGPYTGTDFVVVGAVTGWEPRRLPPMREVIADVKRRADADRRKTITETERLAYYNAHRDRWRGTRARLTRVLFDPFTVPARMPPAADVDRWYAQHGRTLFGQGDHSSAWIPPVTDSLRGVVRERMMTEERDRRTAEVTAKLTAALPTARDVRGTARANGAAADTLSMITDGPRDSLFTGPFADSLLASALHTRGTFQGPRRFGRYVALWRVDAADTGFVRPYELVRAASDQGLADQKRAQDEVDARVYFDAHRFEFRTPVKYALDYVAVPVPSPDSVKVPDADVRRWYDTHPEDFRQEEQIRARHILFLTRGLTPDAERRAKARADSLLAAIRKNGGDFAELAKQFSQEPGASASGGDLGWFGHGRMVPEFEKAAFALPPGGISPVVKTAFGYHIIRVEDRRAAGLRPFGEVRISIHTVIAQARADTSARRAALALRRRLATPPVKGAKPPDLKTTSATPIAATEPIPGVGPAAGLAADLPKLAVGRWAPGVYRAGNQYLAVRLREKVPEAPAPFDDVRSQAVEATKNAKRHELLDAKVAAARTALAAGAPLDSLAAPYGGVRESGLVGRTVTFVPMVGNEPRVIERAFTMKAGERSDTLQIAQGVVWLRVAERRSGDPATYGVASAQIREELTKQRYDRWLDERKQAVRIEILRPDLKAAARPAPPPRMVSLGG